MATNVNLGQSVWNADDIVNPVTTVFCVVIYVDCIYYTVIFSTKYNMITCLNSDSQNLIGSLFLRVIAQAS